jgi:hypothetical protein
MDDNRTLALVASVVLLAGPRRTRPLAGYLYGLFLSRAHGESLKAAQTAAVATMGRLFDEKTSVGQQVEALQETISVHEDVLREIAANGGVMFNMDRWDALVVSPLDAHELREKYRIQAQQEAQARAEEHAAKVAADRVAKARDEVTGSDKLRKTLERIVDAAADSSEQGPGLLPDQECEALDRLWLIDWDSDDEVWRPMRAGVELVAELRAGH